MFRRVLRFALTVCPFAIISTFVQAQRTTQPPGSVALPVLGYLLDNAGGLRPLIGIPGSASVGAALTLNLVISQAAVAPGNGYILADSSTGVVLLKTQGSSFSQQTIPGFSISAGNKLAACDGLGTRSRAETKTSTCAAELTPTRSAPAVTNIVWSSTGSAAALYSESLGRIYSLGNLLQTPTIVAIFDVRALGTPSTFAISDDGLTLGVGISSGSLFLLTSGRPVQPAGTIQHPSAIRFLANSAETVVADDRDNKVYMISKGQLFEIASADDGISAPVALALSNDNQRLFVGNSEPGSITTIQLSGGSSQSTVCHCKLAGLYPTNADSVFRVTDYSGGPVVLFDSSASQPRIVFVPAGSQF